MLLQQKQKRLEAVACIGKEEGRLLAGEKLLYQLYQQAAEGCSSRLHLKTCCLAAMNGVEAFHSFLLRSGKGHLSALNTNSSQWLQPAVLITQGI